MNYSKNQLGNSIEQNWLGQNGVYTGSGIANLDGYLDYQKKQKAQWPQRRTDGYGRPRGRSGFSLLALPFKLARLVVVGGLAVVFWPITIIYLLTRR